MNNYKNTSLFKKIKEGVKKSLIEARDIKNDELREHVYDAWALSLMKNGYGKIEEIELSDVPGGVTLKTGTQTDHLRGIARLSVAISKELEKLFENFRVDMDEVIAGGLCHDLGKPFEYNKKNCEKWESNPSYAGKPSIRHPAYGVYIALLVGLPEKIAHIAGAHSMEGKFVKRSLVAEIIHYADEAYWDILENAGIVEDSMKK